MSNEIKVESDIDTRYLYFNHEEWNRRYNEVIRKINEKKLDAVIITSTENIFYLTGFNTTGYYYFQTLVIPAEGEPFLLVRKMERLGALTQTWLKKENIFSYYDTEDPLNILSNKLRKYKKVKKIGYEKESALFPATHQEKLIYMIPSIEFIDMFGLVEEIRQCKSDQEINVMKLAGKATIAGMKGGIESIKIGVCDNEIASCIYRDMFKEGGEYPACPSFVAVGERGAIGHATWNGRIVKNNDLVFLEVGGCKYRYHAPMMRTCYVGSKLPKMIKEAEELLNECLEKCMDEMKPGTIIRDVDMLSKRILNKNTFNYVYDNRLGYSVGCAFSPGWGEDTVITINGTEEREFKLNMMFHLIPFMMIPGIGSVGISETVQIKESGAKSIFDFPRKIFLIND